MYNTTKKYVAGKNILASCQAYGMMSVAATSAKRGFTLLELLVVVLIIGILAAIALPQYQKAVAKSRLIQDLVRVRALHTGAEMYYLARGLYPSDVRLLDLDITSGAEVKPGTYASGVPAAFYPDGTECMIHGGYYAICGKSTHKYFVQYNVGHPLSSALDPDKQSCCGELNTPMEAVCQAMAHKTRHDWVNNNYRCYFLN